MTDDERRKHLANVLSQVARAFVLPQVPGARMAGRIVFFHLVHLRDLFTSVTILLVRGHGHGAFALGRSMFETSLTLGAMENPRTREAVALRWLADSNKLNRRLVKLAPTPEIRAEVETALRENDSKLEKARRELGVEKLPPTIVPEREAKRQGRDEDLANYLGAHSFTHGGYQALALRVEHHPTEERSQFFLNAERHPNMLESAANFAGRSALLGLASACRIFERPEPAELPRLLELLEFPDSDDVVRVE